MKTTPTVSVIIPVYNAERYIEQCLLSVFSQTYNHIEVVIINDGCTDMSMAIVSDIVSNNNSKYKTTIINNPQNMGIAATRNIGINAAQGEYLYFVDSDDTITPDSIELIVEPILKDDEIELVIGNYYRQFPNGNKSGLGLLLDEGLINGNADIKKTFFGLGWMTSPWSKLVKRSFLLDNNLFFYAGKIHDDYLWNFTLALNLTKVYIVKNSIYVYWYRQESVSNRAIIDRMPDFQIVYEEMVAYANKYGALKYSDCVEYIECARSLTLATLMRSTSSVKEKKFWYMSIRDDIYPKRKNYLYIFKYSGKDLMRNIHYLLPKSMGFWYFISLHTINIYIGYFVHHKRR